MEIKEKWIDKDGREFNIVAFLHTKQNICVYDYMEKQGNKLTYYLATVKDNGDEPFVESYSCNDGEGFQTIDDLVKFKRTMKYVRKLAIDAHISTK